MENLNFTNNDLELNMNLANANGFLDDLEGIVNNEPIKNKYETVKFHKLNIFPYYLIGKVISKFDFDGTNKYLNGVGMLIGPNILLTVAHNLCHLHTTPIGNKKILTSKKVCFFAVANGDFNLFEPVKSERIYIPPKYIESLKTDNREEQLYNDWGLVFLSSNIGEKIVEILDVEKTNYIKITNNLYQFFYNNHNINLNKLSQQTKSEKISIVGYTEFKDSYRNNPAYKFLSNFSKNETTSPEKNFNFPPVDFSKNKINFNFANQGKLISELVNDKELFGGMTNDKKININININTDTEGLLASHQRFNFPKSTKDLVETPLGLDYIILGNEEFNKDFDFNDSDKLIMSESKGNIIGFQLDDELEGSEDTTTESVKAIKYQISTYKGQSGSPIFMRIKKISDKNDKSKNNYFYHFIGLHSRRGPIAGEQKFYESEKMNALTENMMTSDMRNMKITDKLNLKRDSAFFDNDSNNEFLKICMKNEIVRQNGVCEYNIALSIVGETIKEINSIVKTQIEEIQNSTEYSNLCAEYMKKSLFSQNVKSEFVLTKIYLNDQIQLSGLFKKTVPLSVLFSFGSKIFNVPREYILLKDLNNEEFSSIHNFNFDCNKKYYEIMQDSENTIVMFFELMLNIKKYGEYISNNILQKFLENYDLEENELKKDFEKKYMKHLFHSIFAEIIGFENNHVTYGKLFKKIRKTILLKLGVIKNKN